MLTKLIIVNPPNPAGYVSNKDSLGGFGQLYPTGAPPFPPVDIPYLAGSASARARRPRRATSSILYTWIT